MLLRTDALRQLRRWARSPARACSRRRAAPTIIRRRRSGRSRISPGSATTSRRRRSTGRSASSCWWRGRCSTPSSASGASRTTPSRGRSTATPPSRSSGPSFPALILAAIAVPTVRGIFQTGAIPGGRRAQGGGRRPPVVVGVPLPGPQHHHGQRGARPGGADGVPPDGDGRRRPQLLAAPVRRQAGRLPRTGRPGSGSRPSRRASIRGSAPSSAASSTGAWRSGCGPRRPTSSRAGWPTCRRCGPSPPPRRRRPGRFGAYGQRRRRSAAQAARGAARRRRRLERRRRRAGSGLRRGREAVPGQGLRRVPLAQRGERAQGDDRPQPGQRRRPLLHRRPAASRTPTRTWPAGSRIRRR